MGPFQYSLEFGEEKKSHEAKSREYGSAPARQCYFLPNISRCSSQCEQRHCRDGGAMTLSPAIPSSQIKRIKRLKMLLYALWLIVWPIGKHSA